MVTSRALNLFDNFNQLTPYAVGFDRIFDQLNSMHSITQHQQDFRHTTSVKGVNILMSLRWHWRALVRMILK